MAAIHHEVVHVGAGELLALVREILAANDVPPVDAEYVAWHLVETNLRGTDSHGVARVPHYVRRLQSGSIRARPNVRFESRATSLGMVDGDHGLGHPIMRRATEEAAKLAERTGAGWVAVKNSSHCGAMAPYGLKLAELGMIGFVFTHVDPMVLPYGGREPFCGTNPLCLTAPGADGQMLCLDMATSIVPWNLVANAATEGISIPGGWGVDKRGTETTNPREVAALHAFGGHKGSGLGIMIDVFCAMLGGAPFGPDIPKMYGDMTEARRLGGLVGAIAISHFVDRSHFEKRVAELMARLGSIPPADGFDRVKFPGEPELETKRRRQREGIPIGIHTLAELNEIAAAHNLRALTGFVPS